MRRISLAFRVVALVAVFGASAVGQQSQSAYPVAGTEATLSDAARTNNFPLFDALFAQGGADATRFAELHAFWKWSMTDRVGGFYGDDVHAKFAAEYPDYAESIADYGIIDANGRAFYPSAETRAFLLKHALAAPVVPVVRVAEVPKKKTTTSTATRFRASKHLSVLKHAATPKPVAVVAIAPTPAKITMPQIVVQQPQPAPVQIPESDDRLARGFALIVAGLLAAGMLTLVFRTPKETA